MRALGRIAVAIAAAQIGAASARPATAPADAPRAAHGQGLLAQIVPETSPAEANTGNPSLAPFKWVGLLAIPDPTPTNPLSIVECTGQFIKPNVVLTAAHCLRDLPASPSGPWPDVAKGTFWLQYQNQQGTPFKVLCGATNPLWTLPSNFAALSDDDKDDAKLVAYQHDFAMLLIDGQSPTGAMPYMLDWKSKFGYATRIGYASDILNGQVVQKAGGAVFFADAIPMLAKSFPAIVVQWAPTTELTSGSSGGAWVANFKTSEGANQNLLIAVTSFSFDSYPGGEGAAYLTAAEFNPLLDFVSKGCKGAAAAPPPAAPALPSGRSFGRQSDPAPGSGRGD